MHLGGSSQRACGERERRIIQRTLRKHRALSTPSTSRAREHAETGFRLWLDFGRDVA